MTLKKIFSYFYPTDKRDRIFYLIALGLLLLLVAYQIDSGPIGPSQHYPDSDLYIRMAEGIKDGQLVTGSSMRSTRILTPFFAALIPLEIHTSFLIVNLIFIALSARVLFSLLQQYGFTRNERWMGVYLLLLMHPAIIYMLTPLIDAGTVFFIITGVFLIQRNAPWHQITGILLLGILNKETCLILLPVLFLHEAFTKEKLDFKRVFMICIPVIVVQRILVYSVTDDIFAASHYMGENILGSYFVNEVVGKGNLELPVAFAPLFLLIILGLYSLTKEDKKRIYYLSPLIFPILPVFFWEYFESRLFLPTYPLMFFLALRGKNHLKGRARYYLILMFLFYGTYWVYLFVRKYI